MPSIIPGSDRAGEVVAVGSKVTRFEKGSKVVTLFMQAHYAGPLTAKVLGTGLGGSIDGTLRQYGIYNENGLVDMPKNLSYLEAGTPSCSALTAWNALYGLKAVLPGDWVLTRHGYMNMQITSYWNFKTALARRMAESPIVSFKVLEPPSKAKEKTPSRNIAETMKLNTRDAREQQIANQIIDRFDRLDFQRLVVSWIINSNSSFRQSEDPYLRAAFEYLNPLVNTTKAHITHITVRRRILQVYEENRTKIKRVLATTPGLIHIAFDGWRSNNRHALYCWKD
ncbi:hypothetical protein FOYG_17350 [Fusarium oxysporum NRRL 32931]|uniref:Alcohol dehydrogenase-like N-terminal domain-containing protein n=1 Tax=Fusarium oxysporum NRRL 32931 TaxID=660029 RepID=W9HB84_FUSOX|nr:hypothetical protein FOYG_17350 [Fusarium oxysporum NRRL 32931]